eukprot:CAMPEP_0114477468 /NCGR_PEP_ID=MMETSP0104-20121206/15379_1 /TAXON_ID=37642 ORGANISM="Paraphysomonas imperforata, Strain PA2" /NCGR_SAMPLE_ID=MMETSP0104 /ASSEMBLY_ACC=CAM_ASM_000202 /LENGTH=89 /DNA_ID=CAMNT_0001652417 /DNA_START=199 /DNA_END=465 /DNA_ORIENTATION=-
MSGQTAFVAGATGVVGRYLLSHFCRKDSGWDVVYAGSRRKVDIVPEEGGAPIEPIEVDLSSREDCVQKLQNLGITHFFFAAYAGSVDVE